MKIDRLETLRQEWQLNKTQFAELLGVTVGYYSHILSGNGKGNLRLEHLENLLTKKGVNPAWVMTGEGETFISRGTDQQTQNLEEKQPKLIVVSKKDLIKGIMKTTGLVVIPGDLAYDILDNLVTKTLSNNPDFPRDYGRAIHVLADSWLSMLELVQDILDQEIEFEYGGKKYTFHRKED